MVVVLAISLFLLVPTPSAQVTDERPHATVYTVDVDGDGNATWNIQLRYRLIGENEISSFETVQEEFEKGNLTVFDGIEEEMRPFANEASNLTGRPMSLSGFERDIRVRDTLTLTEGLVSVSFNWSNFAGTNGSVVRVGDVFAGGGLALADDERLVVESTGAPPVSSVSPEPDTRDDGRFVWDGEIFFGEGQPSVVFGDPPETDADTNGTDVNRTDDDNVSRTDGSPTAATVIAGILVLLSGFAGGFYLSRSGFFGGETRKETATSEDGDEEETVDDELLTDEDRVVRILRQNGGKMRQAEIVERTEWSKSKVSMLLSDMEEDGTVSKLRLGRENVIELEDSEGNG